MHGEMNILVTLDANYVPPLRVMLYSLFLNNPGERFHIFLLHSSIPSPLLAQLEAEIAGQGHDISVIKAQEDWFAQAPVIKHYTKEMYYRLLAFRYLPEHLDKVLYLDPDILIINSIRPLYNTDINNYLYAACFHNNLPVRKINKLRLKAYEMEEYFNSGVLLMNLERQRKHINEEEIFSYVSKYRNRLILPDQDVLNALYSNQIKKVDEALYNYDTRQYSYYKLRSNGEVDMGFIIRNTSILHFCGKRKPWHKNYSSRFHSLYKHYELRAQDAFSAHHSQT